MGRKRKPQVGTVFSFTFQRHTGRKGYRVGTFAGMLVCFLLPLVIMTLVETLSGGSDEEELLVCRAGTVYVADSDGDAGTSASILERAVGSAAAEGNAEGEAAGNVTAGDDAEGEAAGNAAAGVRFAASEGGVKFVPAESFEQAYEQAEADGDALVLAIDEAEGGYHATVILPDESGLSDEDAEALETYVQVQFGDVLMAKAGLSLPQLISLGMATQVTYGEEALEDDGDFEEGMREILGYLLPYLNIMVLYFLILFYGQSVSTCVLMEKTSKLMDTFLIAVKPRDLLIGKLLGTVLAAFLQVVCWIIGLVGGFAAGTFAVKQINPGTDMALIKIFDSLEVFGGLFSLSGFVLGCAILLAGFLLYCALGSIGGALAGKPEDLSTTNGIYVMVLLISFFVTLSGTKPWMDWVPFTAVLVTPGRMLAGETSFAQGLLSLMLTVLGALVMVLIASKIYRVMALYKGKIPTMRQVLAMMGIKGKKKQTGKESGR